MTHVLITGAGGFVGAALAQRLLAGAATMARPLRRLTAIDQQLDAARASWLADARVHCIEADFGAPDALRQALADAPDVVFHLASVPGSLAERERELGIRVNLQASLDLLHALASRGMAPAPRVVFASTIAVYGPLPADIAVTEATPARPALSYGAHKLMTEIALADLSRRGLLDGVSLRLPGIVARPLSAAGHGSAFMSDLIRRLRGGEPYVCPVSAPASVWWMSLPCCVANLLHAACLPAARLPATRVVQLPVLTATVGQLVEAIEAGSAGRHADVRYQPDAQIEQLFGRFPPLEVPQARALGFVDDGDLHQLVARAAPA